MEQWELQYEKDLNTLTRSGATVFKEEDKLKNIELRNSVRDILPIDDNQKLSDCDLLYRFLIARKWDCKVAEEHLREYVEFRKRERINGILAEVPHPEIASVLAVVYGFDKDGYPVLWLSLDPDKLFLVFNMFDEKSLMRAQIQIVEQARFLSKSLGVDRCTYVISFKKGSAFNTDAKILRLLKSMSKMLQALYPETVRRILVFNSGLDAVDVWMVLKPLIDVRVQDKVKFFNASPNTKSLAEFIDVKNILPEFGGTGETSALGEMLEQETMRLREALPGELSLPTIVVTGDSPEPPSPGLKNVSDEACSSARIEANVTFLHSIDSVGVGQLNAAKESGVLETDSIERQSIDSGSSFYSCPSEVEEENLPAPPSPLPEMGEQGKSDTLAVYSGDERIGMFSSGRVYCQAKWPEAIPHSEASKPAQSDDMNPNELPKELSLKLVPSGSVLPTPGWVFGGELLRESKHPIHSYVIICDALRNTRFVLKKNIIRKRITIFRVPGNPRVETNSSQEHVVTGRRVEVAVVVPPKQGSRKGLEWVILTRNPNGSDFFSRYIHRSCSCSASTLNEAVAQYNSGVDASSANPTANHDISKENDLSKDDNVIGSFENGMASFFGPLAGTPLPIVFLLLTSITQMWSNTKSY